MPCPDANLLGRTVDGDLTEAERRDLEVHLDACGPCARVVRDLGGLLAYAHAPSRYAFRSEIARGGMGRVIDAVDTLLGRPVACKEALGGDAEARRRFQRETRITARLEHPSIVPVYDAGTSADGSPYYVMRRVVGKPLDELVARAGKLDERLVLATHVIAAAQGVAHAHQRGVVHRDLKPSNILVGDLGETVVIDWGLAKVIDEPDDEPTGGLLADAGGSLRTQVGAVMGTPGFMAPELVRGESADPRSDVYAFGATLASIFTGFVAPPELAAIVERAMSDAPQARYATARELAEDLLRWQNGQLVGAHRYSTRQLFRRWLRRHRAAVVATVAATVVAVGIGIVALGRVFAAQELAEEQRARAVDNEQHAEELMEFMLGDLRLKLTRAGQLELLDAIARRASAYYDTKRAGGSAEELFLSGVAERTLGGVLGARSDLVGARREYEKALAAFDQAAALRPDVTRYATTVLLTAGAVVELQAALGDLAGAMQAQRLTAARARQLVQAFPTDTGVREAAITSLHTLSELLVQHGELAGALQELHDAVALGDADATPSIGLLQAHASIGHLLVQLKRDPAGALAEYRLALHIGELAVTSDPTDTMWQGEVATSHDEIGRLLQDTGDLTGAVAEFRAGLAIVDKVAKADPSNTSWSIRRSALHSGIGDARVLARDPAGALAEFQAAYQIDVELAARDPRDLHLQRSLSVDHNSLGDVEYAIHDLGAARASFRAALAIREQLVATDPSNAEWRRDLFYSHIKLAELSGASPGKAGMLDELRAALAIASESAAQNPTNPDAQQDVAATQEAIGDRLVELQDPAGARAAYTEALAIATRFHAAMPADADWAALRDKLDRLVR